jgi:flagellar protein FliO/FliZ
MTSDRRKSNSFFFEVIMKKNKIRSVSKQTRALIAAVGFTVCASFAFAANLTEIGQVDVDRKNGNFTATLFLKSGKSIQQAQATFIDETLQIDIPDSMFNQGRHIIQLNGKTIKAISVGQSDATTTRVRILFNKGFPAARFEKALHLVGRDNILSIEIPAVAAVAQSTVDVANLSTRTYQVSGLAWPEVAASDASIASAVKVETSSGLGATSTIAQTQVSTRANERPAIVGMIPAIDPALANAGNYRTSENKSEAPAIIENKKDASIPFEQILIALNIFVMIAGGALVVLKKPNRPLVVNNQVGSIRIVSHHPVGPKQSVWVLQFAGESILMGVTEQNISMLKAVSVLDEKQQPMEKIPRTFTESLSEYNEDVLASRQSANDLDEQSEEFFNRGLSEVRDVVANRLQNLRKV